MRVCAACAYSYKSSRGSKITKQGSTISMLAAMGPTILIKNVSTPRRERSPPKRSGAPNTIAHKTLDNETDEVHTASSNADASHPRLKAIFPPPSPEPKHNSPTDSSISGSSTSNVNMSDLSIGGSISTSRREDSAPETFSTIAPARTYRGNAPLVHTNAPISAFTGEETSRVALTHRTGLNSAGSKVAMSAEACRAIHEAHRHFLEEARQLEAELDAVVAAVAKAASTVP